MSRILDKDERLKVPLPTKQQIEDRETYVLLLTAQVAKTDAEYKPLVEALEPFLACITPHVRNDRRWIPVLKGWDAGPNPKAKISVRDLLNLEQALAQLEARAVTQSEDK